VSPCALVVFHGAQPPPLNVQWYRRRRAAAPGMSPKVPGPWVGGLHSLPGVSLFTWTYCTGCHRPVF
jgi:hypothetical protein